jgi:hypothetical protein
MIAVYYLKTGYEVDIFYLTKQKTDIKPRIYYAFTAPEVIPSI